MKSSLRLSVAALLSLLAVVPAQPQSRPDFNALRNQWIQDLQSHKLDASLALYADDATFMNADGSRVTGDGIRHLFETVFKSFRATIAMSSRASAFSGFLAYDAGSYDEIITVIATGESKHLSGGYLTVYRRRSAGKWEIVQQVWTQAPGK